MMTQSTYNLLRSLTEAEQVEFVDRYVTDAEDGEQACNDIQACLAGLQVIDK
jgi:hypothetical protein